MLRLPRQTREGSLLQVPADFQSLALPDDRAFSSHHPSQTEKRRANIVALAKLFRGSFLSHASMLKHVRAVGYAERKLDVLFDQQNRDILVVNANQNCKQFLD